MDLLQEIFAFAVIVGGALLLLSRLERKRWLELFMFAYALHVPLALLTVALPSQMKEFIFSYMIKGELDVTHLFVYQVMVTPILGLAIAIFMNRRSPDAYTKVVIFFHFLLHSALWAVSVLLRPEPDKGKEGAPPKGASIAQPTLWYYKFFGLCIVHGVAILLNKEFFGHSQLNSRLNMHLKIDFLVGLVLGIVIFAYPQWCLGFLTGGKAFDQVHVVFSQMYGALLIGSAILSSLYTSALMAANKRNLLMSRVLETLAMIVLILYTSFATKALNGSIQVTLLLYGLISFNALLGYYSPHETDSYVSNKDD